MLKKAVTLLFILISAVMMSYGSAAQASTGTPHVVVDGEVWLLDEAGNKIYLLPNTYYARINNLDDSYYYVTFNGVSGKVSKNVVTTTGYHTTATGTSFEMQINDGYLEFVSINLKSTPSLSAANVAEVPTSASFTFIGEYPTQEGIWYYIKYNQYYGYIKQERTTATTLNIPSFRPETAPVESGDDNKEGTSDNGLLDGLEGSQLRTLIIVGLSIPAVLIIFLIFRPSKHKKYYD